MNFYRTPKLFPSAMRITYSKGIATVTFDSILPLDDLPENVLVEILCRLPWKFVIRCKCVSKSWLTLISLPYFQTCRALYLRNSSDDNFQILMSIDITRRGRQAKDREFFTISSQTYGPVLTSLNFHPSRLIPPLDIEMSVKATYNDLILMSDTSREYCNFYICNPYTKQWVALPPASGGVYAQAPVGFICDSDNRCSVVRLFKYRCNAFGLTHRVEVFTSETGKWIVSDVECPQGSCFYDGSANHLKLSIAPIAYNGTLYWLYEDGLLFGLEPFKLNDNHHCRITATASVEYDGQKYTECLGVCRGSVRLCRLYIQQCVTLCVWELKEEEDDGGKMMTWCLKKSASLINTGFERGNPQLLALDPNDEDIIYLLHSTRRNSSADITVTCNIRTMKVTDISHMFPSSDFEMEAFPFVLPWWQCPTPVPRLD